MNLHLVIGTILKESESFGMFLFYQLLCWKNDQKNVHLLEEVSNLEVDSGIAQMEYCLPGIAFNDAVHITAAHDTFDTCIVLSLSTSHRPCF